MQEVIEIVTAFGGIANVSSTGLLAVVFILIIRGELVPAKTNAFLISERDVWKEAAQKQQETNAKQAEALEALSETGRTMDHIIRSLPKPTGELSPGKQGESE